MDAFAVFFYLTIFYCHIPILLLSLSGIKLLNESFCLCQMIVDVFVALLFMAHFIIIIFLGSV